ncbi:unnamed protein product [Rhizophagus irregularis]|nr:unnamed protein product [Rhizophagus irregularis]
MKIPKLEFTSQLFDEKGTVFLHHPKTVILKLPLGGSCSRYPCDDCAGPSCPTSVKIFSFFFLKIKKSYSRYSKKKISFIVVTI